jgi:YD repeat-containing protein
MRLIMLLTVMACAFVIGVGAAGLGAAAHFSYDAAGRLTHATDSEGVTRNWVYDNNDNIVSVITITAGTDSDGLDCRTGMNCTTAAQSMV